MPLSDGAFVEVCNPVRVQFVLMINRPIQSKRIAGEAQEPDPTMPVDWFVPVNKLDTWAFARRFDALPLTAAVADHSHLQATAVTKPASPELRDFATYSKRLDGYASLYDRVLLSGAHKIWALSNVRSEKSSKELPSVNYGFHHSLPPKGRITEAIKYRVGTPLEGVDVIQGLAAGHNESYWDYSQLLQLMRAPRGITYKGELYTLREAVTRSLPPVWDEKEPLRAEQLA